MPIESKESKSYLELSEHDSLQVIIFNSIIVIVASAFFLALLPLIENLIQNFLSGVVYNSGEEVSYSLEQSEPQDETSYFFRWAVDLYVKTPDESRYWFNPTLALFLPSLLVGVLTAISITIMLPDNVGFMSRKIERELINLVHRFSYLRSGYYSRKEEALFAGDVKNASLRELNEMAEELKISLEDLRLLKKALIWRDSGMIKRLFRMNDGLIIYMRMHFTVKYSNAMLGLVYIGAAVLIVIIGLRGLKLVPSTQPTIILFALSLEFCFLILYAITVIYSKEEEEQDMDNQPRQQPETTLANGGFGTSKEIERMLRVFLKSERK